MSNTSLLAIPPEIDTPSLVIDLDVLERNIADMAAFAAERGVGLAPHAKTHRTPEIARLQIDAGAEALCIAKLGEAEALRDAAGMQRAGATADVLVIVNTGYDRCGVSPEEAVEFGSAVATLGGIRLRGLITHEGHAYADPGDEGILAGSVAAGNAMVATAEALRERGVDVDVEGLIDGGATVKYL